MNKCFVKTSIGLAIALLLTAGVMANDKPSLDLDWYGYVKADASYDQNLTSHGNFAMWVKPLQTAEDDAQFNMTANQTRLGINAAGKGYEKVGVSGKVEFDLYGGVSGATVAQNKAMLQLRHAYFTVKSGDFKLLAGQSWDLISPLNPSTLNYPVLWGCGNAQYRRPQVSMFYTLHPGTQTSATLAGGFFRTIGNDLTPTLSLATEVADATDDGTDAAIPTFQGRLDVAHKFSSGAKLRFGISGLYGKMEADGSLGTSEEYESSGVFGHFMLSFAQGFGFSGEAFTGSNLGGYFGAIANASRIDGLDATGGWGSCWVSPHKKVKFTGGFGVDDPDDADLSAGNRGKNSCYFGNVKYTIVPQVIFGVEVSQWKTEYVEGDTAEALRAQSSFTLSF